MKILFSNSMDPAVAARTPKQSATSTGKKCLSGYSAVILLVILGGAVSGYLVPHSTHESQRASWLTGKTASRLIRDCVATEGPPQQYRTA
jgi:hypothetical protein